MLNLFLRSDYSSSPEDSALLNYFQPTRRVYSSSVRRCCLIFRFGVFPLSAYTTIIRGMSVVWSVEARECYIDDGAAEEDAWLSPAMKRHSIARDLFI